MEYSERTNEQFPDKFKVNLLLRMLPEQHENEIRMRNLTGGSIKFDVLREQVNAWVQQHVQRTAAQSLMSIADHNEEDEPVDALKAKGKGRLRGASTSAAVVRPVAKASAKAKFQGTCNYCKKEGHKAQDCRRKANDLKSGVDSRKGRDASTLDDEEEEDEEEDLGVIDFALDALDELPDDEFFAIVNAPLENTNSKNPVCGLSMQILRDDEAKQTTHSLYTDQCLDALGNSDSGGNEDEDQDEDDEYEEMVERYVRNAMRKKDQDHPTNEGRSQRKGIKAKERANTIHGNNLEMNLDEPVIPATTRQTSMSPTLAATSSATTASTVPVFESQPRVIPGFRLPAQRSTGRTAETMTYELSPLKKALVARSTGSTTNDGAQARKF